MPLNVENLDILKLQTKAMQQDQTTKAMSVALNPTFSAIALEIRKCLLLARVEELTEEELDELAWELKINWYDATAAVEIKRALVKNSDKVHMYLGTPYAVETVIQDYFGDGYVQEWFEYGGSPGMFKVITNNVSVSDELANQFIKVLDSVKNKRSHLEQIIIALSGELNNYYAGVVHTGDFLEVRQVI